MTEDRVPERGHGVRDHELGRLNRVVGMEVVPAFHLDGQVNDLPDRLLRRPGLAGRQRRQGVGHQPFESKPPLRPLGVVHPAVPGHVGTGLGQLCELGHLRQDRGPGREPASSALLSAARADEARPRYARGPERSPRLGEPALTRHEPEPDLDANRHLLTTHLDRSVHGLHDSVSDGS